MLIEFSVENFRSIRDKQTLSMEAFGSKFLSDSNTFEVELAGGKSIRLLRSAVIYGANASGKSNLIRAFYNFWYLLTGTFKSGKGIDCYEPFKLDLSSKTKPTYFKILFIGKNAVKYGYEIAYGAEEITFEKLVYYPNGQPATLFERSNSFEMDGFHLVTLKNKLEGKRFIKTNILKNQLFLSKFGENAHQQLTPIYDYLSNIKIGNAFKNIALKKLEKSIIDELRKPENQIIRTRLNNLIRIADTKIESVSVRELQENDFDKLDFLPNTLKDKFIHDNQYTISAAHDVYEADTIVDTTDIDIEEESVGTQILLSLGFLVLKTLESGGIFIFDELDNSLHPQLSGFLARLFNNSLINTRNSQIIFSTHEVLFLDRNTFRKDQIWFTEKDKKGVTELFSANDFEGVRDDMPFDKWYLAGKFGATPHILESKFFLNYE